jgi:hypothetical protein
MRAPTIRDNSIKQVSMPVDADFEAIVGAASGLKQDHSTDVLGTTGTNPTMEPPAQPAGFPTDVVEYGSLIQEAPNAGTSVDPNSWDDIHWNASDTPVDED